MLKIASRIEGLKALLSEKETQKAALQPEEIRLRQAEKERIRREEDDQLYRAFIAAESEIAEAKALLDRKQQARDKALKILTAFRRQPEIDAERERIRLATGKII